MGGDGSCDNSCLTKECEFDLNDCCAEMSDCQSLSLATDKTCHPECVNIYCNYDDGACCDSSNDLVTCTRDSGAKSIWLETDNAIRNVWQTAVEMTEAIVMHVWSWGATSLASVIGSTMKNATTKSALEIYTRQTSQTPLKAHNTVTSVWTRVQLIT